ncbi:MAG TPA: ROK family glucokinase [Candidatus Scybalocola faecigallinarum]|uniref:Glucokinase n=1 Tax=Candidatus Scybalocola faecigallinarum TaxID=2840941 RepID=A0A9D1F514_9FIRM|nr:ROK family glucokinase [Candidatus Scybalocola faecigallinarum]
MSKICFGIDIGGTTVKIGVLSLEGELMDKWEIHTRTEEGGKYILGDIADSVKKYVADKGLNMADVVGAGMGVPGPVTEDGTVLRCVNLGWGVFNCAKELSDLLGVPVKAGNDANVAALGEQWQGGGKGHDDLVVVTLGTGVGGGIILGGKILAGVNGAAGEIGHMQVVAPEDTIGVCGCGNSGCLEQVASATGIVKLAKRLVEETDTPTSLRELSQITAKDVLDAAKAGDAGAVSVVETMAKYLGSALAAICAVVNPEMIVIGGGVSKAGQYLIDKIQEAFIPKAFHALRDTQFALATLGNDAGMVGAARLVLQ